MGRIEAWLDSFAARGGMEHTRCLLLLSVQSTIAAGVLQQFPYTKKTHIRHKKCRMVYCNYGGHGPLTTAPFPFVRVDTPRIASSGREMRQKERQ